MFNNSTNHSTPDRIWASLLFKIVSVPFIGLLLVLIATQTMSLQNYSADEPGLNDSGAFVEVTTF